VKAGYPYRVMISQNFAFCRLAALLSLVTLACGGRTDDSTSDGSAAGGVGGTISVRNTSDTGGQGTAQTTGSCGELVPAARAGWPKLVEANSACVADTDCVVGDFWPYCVPGYCDDWALSGVRVDIMRTAATKICQDLTDRRCLLGGPPTCPVKSAMSAICVNGVCTVVPSPGQFW